MRTTFIALMIAVSGMSGQLHAASRHHGGVHKVRRGETAARIARDSGISVQDLHALNPGINLSRLAAGMTLRVHGETRAAAVAPGKLETGRPGALGTRVVKAQEPVAPLPGTPAIGPASLVHLEGVLPAAVAVPPPGGNDDSDRSKLEPATAPIPLAGMRRALPEPVPSEEDEPEELLPLPSGLAAGTAFMAADRANLDLLWPVATRTISSAWGPRIRTRVVRVRTSSRNKRVLRRFMGTHKGVDLSSPMGRDIFAALDGQVVAAGKQKQYGNFVALDHGNGVVTFYAHCNRNFVEPGAIVHRGQKIAEVGRTGNATGPHVHFELRLDGVPQNPLPFMNDTEAIPADMVAQNQAALPPGSAR